MTDRPAHLPDYRSPPIAEVAIGVEFSPLQAMRQAHLGIYWERIRTEYPTADDQPAIPPTQDFAPNAFMMPAFRVVPPGGSIPPNRTVFASLDKDRLIQLQQDRFINNWKGVGENYPRFEVLRGEFRKRWNDFALFSAEERLGPIIPQRVEVTYVNHILADSPADFLEAAGRLDINRAQMRPTPLDVGLNVRYDAGDGGLLQVLLSRPLQSPLVTGQPVGGWLLSFIFRCLVPDSAREESTYELLDRAREVIDSAFLELTREDVQKERWGRID